MYFQITLDLHWQQKYEFKRSLFSGIRYKIYRTAFTVWESIHYLHIWRWINIQIFVCLTDPVVLSSIQQFFSRETDFTKSLWWFCIFCFALFFVLFRCCCCCCCFTEHKDHCNDVISYHIVNPSWWRHQMETFSALLAICAGNSPGTGDFPAQRPVTRSFGVFFDPRLNKRLGKQSRGWRFETPSRPLWRHGNGDANFVFNAVSCLSSTVCANWLTKWFHFWQFEGLF